MKLIVGLGNPGEKYENTRHNAGFLVVEALASSMGSGKWEVSKKHQSQIIKNQSLIFAKPNTFMNDSGTAVQSLSSFYHIQPKDIYVVHDDLDIKLGEYKIQLGVGPKVHNGINDTEEKLGTKDFWRVRVGIDNRESDLDLRVNGVAYVLQKFSPEEIGIVVEVIEKLVKELGKTGF